MFPLFYVLDLFVGQLYSASLLIKFRLSEEKALKLFIPHRGSDRTVTCLSSLENFDFLAEGNKKIFCDVLCMKANFDWTRLALAVWWSVYCILALYAIGDNPDSVEGGDLLRQVLVVSFGCLGLFHWNAAVSRLKSVKGIWLAVLIAYIAWSCSSLLWSHEVSLTIRRLVQFLIIGIASIGLGAGYYGGESGPGRFCKDFQIGCLIMIAICLPILLPELTLTNLLNPLWESEIRTRSSDMPGVAAVGLIACIAPVANTRRYTLTSTWTAAIVFAFLILIKSRSIAGLSCLVFVYLFTNTLSSKLLRTILRAGMIGTILMMSLSGLIGNMMGGSVGEFVARGNSEKVLFELNGRLPLWNYVWNDIQVVYMKGVGFGAYWDPARMGEVYRAVKWHAPVAHNGYLDEWVQTGIIGLILMLSFLGLTCAKLRQLSKRVYGAQIAIPWIVLFLLLNCFDSYFQNLFRTPVLCTVIITFSCLSTGWRPRMRQALLFSGRGLASGVYGPVKARDGCHPASANISL